MIKYTIDIRLNYMHLLESLKEWRYQNQSGVVTDLVEYKFR